MMTSHIQFFQMTFASFEKQEEAERALENLFVSMKEKIIWDVRDFKQRDALSAGL